MLSPEQQDQIRDMYRKGMNDAQIGDQLGVDRGKIRRFRNKFELPAIGVARPSITTKVTDAQLNEWVEQRLSITEMAARGEVAYSTISKRLMRLKLNVSKSAQANREAAEPACETADAFLAAFQPGRYLPPTNSRMAETSNRDGRIYGLPAPAFHVSSLYGA